MQKQTPCAHALSQHFSLDSDLLVRVLSMRCLRITPSFGHSLFPLDRPGAPSTNAEKICTRSHAKMPIVQSIAARPHPYTCSPRGGNDADFGAPGLEVCNFNAVSGTAAILAKAVPGFDSPPVIRPPSWRPRPPFWTPGWGAHWICWALPLAQCQVFP